MTFILNSGKLSIRARPRIACIFSRKYTLIYKNLSRHGSIAGLIFPVPFPFFFAAERKGESFAGDDARRQEDFGGAGYISFASATTGWLVLSAGI